MRKGTKHTEASKIKCGSVNKGKKLTEEHRRKISENSARYWKGKKLGDRLSPEGRTRIIYALQTRKISPKVVEHMKNLNKGVFSKDHPCYRETKKRPFYKSIRETYKYRQWRTSIFKRDNFKCVLCGTGGYIEADHCPTKFIEIIRKFSVKTLEQALNCIELWDINNGRTLCRKCHQKTITWGRRTGHSKSSLIEVETLQRATLRKRKHRKRLSEKTPTKVMR